jgi:hypothetical protein
MYSLAAAFARVVVLWKLLKPSLTKLKLLAKAEDIKHNKTTQTKPHIIQPSYIVKTKQNWGLESVGKPYKGNQIGKQIGNVEKQFL